MIARVLRRRRPARDVAVTNPLLAAESAGTLLPTRALPERSIERFLSPRDGVKCACLNGTPPEPCPEWADTRVIVECPHTGVRGPVPLCLEHIADLLAGKVKCGGPHASGHTLRAWSAPDSWVIPDA